MNKYFITFGAVALSFGAVYGAEINSGEDQESAGIGGTSVAKLDLLAAGVEESNSSPSTADTKEPETVKGKREIQLTPDVRSVILPGDSRAKDSDSTDRNSGTPRQSAPPTATTTPAVASPAINAQKGT